MFNALEIKLDTFHCLKKIRNKTEQKPQRKNQQSIKQQEKKNAMKRNLYIRNTHTKHIPHGREIPSNKKKRRHLSYNAENIKEIWVQWGWRNRAFL